MKFYKLYINRVKNPPPAPASGGQCIILILNLLKVWLSLKDTIKER